MLLARGGLGEGTDAKLTVLGWENGIGHWCGVLKNGGFSYHVN